MIYEIESKYYVKVGSIQYARIDLIINNDTVSLKPTTDYLEVSHDTVVKQIQFNDTFKKEYIEKHKSKYDSDLKSFKKINK